MSTFKDRVKEALHEDSSIAVTKGELSQTQGFSTEYLGILGLKQSDLKKLERKGLAVRGYLKVSKGSIFKGSEYQKRWVLYV